MDRTRPNLENRGPGRQESTSSILSIPKQLPSRIAMTSGSRRAILGGLVGALVCAPFPGLAYSVEPILRDPKGLVADIYVTSSDAEGEALRVRLRDAASSQVVAILRDEVQKARLAVAVGAKSSDLGDTKPSAILYLRMRMDIKTAVVSDESFVI